jgi:murein DD-endopeptidase MepM/ murein hydrolase activator NlpD
MQVLITHGSVARTRVLQFRRWQIVLAACGLVVFLLAVSGTVYHFVFLKAAREGWPVVSPLVRLVVRDEIAQRDRFMRENLDAMAQKVGELQAKLVKLEAMGERVAGLVNIKPEDLRPLKRSAVDGTKEGTKDGTKDGAKDSTKNGAKPAATASNTGGPYLPLHSPSLEQLQSGVATLDEGVDFNTDLYTLFESRLLQSRLTALMIPSAAPLDVASNSGFGFRTDPFTGRPALHTGLDFPAEPGTAIRAAAGGIVTSREVHLAYGQLLEIDHGNGVVTRYAHCSSIDVAVGALVKRGQPVARVGSSGRSTGPHLHFEVLVAGVPQDPARFLAQGAALQQSDFAARPGQPAGQKRR